MSETEEVKTETDHAWAKITRSSSKDGGIGFEFGFSSATGNVAEVGSMLGKLESEVKQVIKQMKEGQ